MTSIMCPTSVKRLWLYRQTAEQEWQVGWFDSLDQWCIDSSHTRSADAADRVLSVTDVAEDAVIGVADGVGVNRPRLLVAGGAWSSW